MWEDGEQWQLGWEVSINYCFQTHYLFCNDRMLHEFKEIIIQIVIPKPVCLAVLYNGVHDLSFYIQDLETEVLSQSDYLIKTG